MRWIDVGNPVGRFIRGREGVLGVPGVPGVQVGVPESPGVPESLESGSVAGLQCSACILRLYQVYTAYGYAVQ